jgi:hypothetical protein
MAAGPCSIMCVRSRAGDVRGAADGGCGVEHQPTGSTPVALHAVRRELAHACRSQLSCRQGPPAVPLCIRSRHRTHHRNDICTG